jgi:hypothetical protein
MQNRKKRSFCFLIFILILATSGKAQKLDSLRYLYSNKLIFRYGNVFVKGSEQLMFRDLPRQLYLNPLAMEHYHKAKNLKTTATVFRIASVSLSLATLAFAKEYDRKQFFYSLGAQFALGLGSFHFQNKSARELDRSLYQYNRVMLFGN